MRSPLPVARHVMLLGSLALAGAYAAPRLLAEDPPAPPAAPAPSEPAPAAVDEAQIVRWVADLGSDDFRVREAASKRLADAGEAARAALAEAERTSDSLEVRWRAHQLLMRLKERAPAAEAGRTPRAPESERGARPGPGGAWGERLRRWLENDSAAPEGWRDALEGFWREFERELGAPSLGGPPPSGWARGMPGLPTLGQRVEAGALTLELPFLGRGSVRLHVRGEDGRVTTHTGASLDEIVAAHAELAAHTDLPALRERVESLRASPFGSWHEIGPGRGTFTFSFQSSEGIEVREDAQGAHVRLQVKNADGTTSWVKLDGTSLEDIKRKHPEHAARIDAATGGLRWHVGPRVIGPNRRGLAPLGEEAPAAPVTPAAPEQRAVRFGVGLLVLEHALALHLGLSPEAGVLVDSVAPGSQAERLGLQRYDVITTIDGQPVTGLQAAADALRRSARDQAALQLEIVRQGQKQVLTR